ncbi:cofilin/tropomyosin family [Schizosaccharomyces osmophilus]|uniref:Cofilin/tropomyosin family n=1 Tax=Schizosaccharomyces osmophilus TaxID=2545709 RepID=A0AAE9WCJ9_9SCHI|nr:cofilin/tropomyosin family [Schizosaccharomyces osmophilus]WBW73375.1 cofilin/tropomyosin family [Schizosaccharomyces osmophilus]
MSFQLDTSSFGFDIKKAHAQVLNGSPDCSWAVFGYAKGQGNVLKLLATGNDDYEFLDEFDENAVLYGFLRVKDSNTGLHKFVLVSWCGEAAPSSRKGLFPIHSATVTRLLNGYHIQVTGRESSDLNLDDIFRRVADASGSKYSSNTSTSSASKPKPAPAPTFSHHHIPPPGTVVGSVPSQKPGIEDNVWNDTYKQRPTQSQHSLRIPVNASWSNAESAQTEHKKEAQASPAAPAPVPEPTSVPAHVPAPVPAHVPAPVPAPIQPTSVPKPASPPVPPSASASESKELKPSISKASTESTKTPTSELEQLHASGNVNLSARRAMFERFQKSGEPSSVPQTRPQPHKLNRSFEAPPKTQTQGVPSGPKVDAFANTNSNDPKEVDSNPPSVASLRSRFANQNLNDKSNSAPASKAQSSKFSPAPSVTHSAPAPVPAPAPVHVAEPVPPPSNVSPLPQAPPVPATPPRPETANRVPSSPPVASYAPPPAPTTPPRPETANRVPSPPPVASYAPPPPQNQQEEVQAENPPPAPAMPPRPESTNQTPPPPPPVAEQSAAPAPLTHLEPSPPVPASSDEEGPPIPPLPPVVETPMPPPPLPPTPNIQTHEGEYESNVASRASESSSKTPAVVIYDYSPEEENEMELTEGERIEIVDFVDEGWWLGENSNGKQGLFPSNYVELLQEETIAPVQASESNVESGSGLISVKAVYDYEAQEGNELTFFENDIITDVDRIDPNWWEGECHGRRGLFPSNYVEE